MEEESRQLTENAGVSDHNKQDSKIVINHFLIFLKSYLSVILKYNRNRRPIEKYLLLLVPGGQVYMEYEKPTELTPEAISSYGLLS